MRAEWADLPRLGRRLVRKMVTSARADEVATLSGVLADHLGPDAASLPVVAESWAPYEHVNLQGALDRWLDAQGRNHTLVGITGFQYRLFTLADLAQGHSEEDGPQVGAVAMARLAAGPAGVTRSCVRCGLYLVSDGPARLAILLREADPRHGHEQTVVEVLCAEPERADAVLGEIRSLALAHSVFRGQVLSFDMEMFGPQDAPLSFHERPVLGRDGLVLPAGVLEAVEAQVMGVPCHRARLVASGQHLKRGVLLHGPSGRG